jgi:hypothetical protein
MEALIIHKDKNKLSVEWQDDEKGFGVITLEYISDGKYILDSEFMSIDTVISIFKALELDDTKQD